MIILKIRTVVIVAEVLVKDTGSWYTLQHPKYAYIVLDSEAQVEKSSFVKQEYLLPLLCLLL